MNIKIINPEALQNLYKNHGKFSATCYNTPIKNDKIAERIGASCEASFHMSGSRCEYIKFEIEADRGTIEQILRSEIGVRATEPNQYLYMDMIEMCPRISPDEVVKNTQSFRYVDKNDFTYDIPENIKNCAEAKEHYDNLMKTINETRKDIRDILFMNGIDYHKAVEDANLILPRATNSKTTIGFTPEALITFMHKRLCVRAQEFIRRVAIEMKKAVEEINPEFAKELMPHCQYLLFCPEKDKSCGAYPTREERLNEIKLNKYFHDSNNFFDENGEEDK